MRVGNRHDSGGGDRCIGGGATLSWSAAFTMPRRPIRGPKGAKDNVIGQAYHADRLSEVGAIRLQAIVVETYSQATAFWRPMGGSRN